MSLHSYSPTINTSTTAGGTSTVGVMSHETGQKVNDRKLL